MLPPGQVLPQPERGEVDGLPRPPQLTEHKKPRDCVSNTDKAVRRQGVDRQPDLRVPPLLLSLRSSGSLRGGAEEGSRSWPAEGWRSRGLGPVSK